MIRATMAVAGGLLAIGAAVRWINAEYVVEEALEPIESETALALETAREALAQTTDAHDESKAVLKLAEDLSDTVEDLRRQILAIVGPNAVWHPSEKVWKNVPFRFDPSDLAEREG